MTQQQGNECRIAIGEEYKLEANLTIPLGSKAIILFAHGSGSSRHSTRNQHVARVLNHTGFATLLVDLLTTEEKQIDETSRHLRFDIDLLARRIMKVTEWLTRDPRTKSLRIVARIKRVIRMPQGKRPSYPFFYLTSCGGYY
jgi:putative phosphoribosyl transferase